MKPLLAATALLLAAAAFPARAQDHGQMDHGQMDHGQMDHGAMEQEDHSAHQTPMPVMTGPRPMATFPPALCPPSRPIMPPMPFTTPPKWHVPAPPC